MLKRSKVMLRSIVNFLIENFLTEAFILKKIFTLLERNFSFDSSNLKLSEFFRKGMPLNPIEWFQLPPLTRTSAPNLWYLNTR